jgi:probable F420-dependent oxidoreductase
MQVIAGMSDRLPLEATGTYARRVESLGFDVLHVPETVHDSLSVALLALEHTSTLRVQTSLTLAFPRSPMLVALQAWDLSRMSGGRFDLGLGTQIRPNVEGRFGVPWRSPVPWMRDYVTTVRAIWHSFSTGDRLHVETDAYRLTRLQPFFDPGPLPHASPRLWLGGINDRAIRLAAEVADGFVTHPTNSHPRFLRERARPLLDGASRRLAIATASPIVTGRTENDVRASREAQRAVLAFLYSTPAYRRTLELFGWADVGVRLQELTRHGRWADLGSILTDDHLDALVPSATWSELPSVIETWFGGLTDGVLVQPPSDPDDDAEFRPVVQAIAAIASSS